MSAIKSLLIFLCFLNLSCTQKKNIAQQGMSEIPKSQYSYMGSAERSLNLKFDIDKSRFSQKAKVTARINLPFNYLSPLQFKWKLGSEVKLISGDLVGSIPKLNQNESVDIAIEVDNFDANYTRFIRFEIVGLDPKKRIFTDGLISSQQKNSFESIVQEVEKINANK